MDLERRDGARTRTEIASQAHLAINALGTQISAAHEATNSLMKVQFDSVKENFERVHASMAEMKHDLREDTKNLKTEVDSNRRLAEERHIALVKKIWTGAGILIASSVVIEILIAVMSRH